MNAVNELLGVSPETVETDIRISFVGIKESEARRQAELFSFSSDLESLVYDIMAINDETARTSE